MSGPKPQPWFRRLDPQHARLWFPYDQALIEDLKRTIPLTHRSWYADEGLRCWLINGAFEVDLAEEWFNANCGRGKEIARCQLELAL